MDQETAQRLFHEGGTFVFLGVPPNTQFGIDLQCWSTEEQFRGVKMIPPGLHYLHYAAAGRGAAAGAGDLEPRSGFMHYFKQRELLVKMWDKKTDDISQEEISDESIQRLKDNKVNLDRHLGPYPYELWHKWKLLTSHITEKLAIELSPENGIIRSAVELMSMTDQDRPRGVKVTTQEAVDRGPGDTDSDTHEASKSSPEHSNAKRPKTRLSAEDRENAMLPDLKAVPGTALRFPQLPRVSCPAGATPAQITAHHLDRTYTLEQHIAHYDDPTCVVGELQFAFVCFLAGSSPEALAHWARLAALLCACGEALRTRTALYLQFVRTLRAQLDELPPELLADIVADRNVVYRGVRTLWRTARDCGADGRLLQLLAELTSHLQHTHGWELDDDDENDEDEKPVVVTLDERGLRGLGAQD